MLSGIDGKNKVLSAIGKLSVKWDLAKKLSVKYPLPIIAQFAILKIVENQYECTVFYTCQNESTVVPESSSKKISFGYEFEKSYYNPM